MLHDKKLRLNKESKKIKKLIKTELKEERGVLKTNLIEIKTMKCLGLDYTNRKFTLILSNVQSIKNKQDIIIELLEDSNADLSVLTETWLTDADEVWVQGSKFHRHHYTMDECHRKGRKGGGLALIAKQTLKVKREEHRITAELEYVKWKVTLPNSFLNILGIYRPPDSSMSQFLDIFTELLVDILTSNTNLVVLGDFNIHVNKIDDPTAGIFLDTMTALGMKQHVTGPTHISENGLDLIFTEEMSKSMVIECSHSMFVSDHSSIQCILNIPKENCNRKEITYRKLKDVDVLQLVREMSLEDIKTENLDEMVEMLEENLSNALNKQAPEVTKVITEKKKKPWFRDDLKQQKRIVRRREKVFRKYQ